MTISLQANPEAARAENETEFLEKSRKPGDAPKPVSLVSLK